MRSQREEAFSLRRFTSGRDWKSCVTTGKTYLALTCRKVHHEAVSGTQLLAWATASPKSRRAAAATPLSICALFLVVGGVTQANGSSPVVPYGLALGQLVVILPLKLRHFAVTAQVHPSQTLLIGPDEKCNPDHDRRC